MKNTIVLFALFMWFLVGTAQSFTETDTTFDVNGLTLQGTFTVPDGAGPFPFVIYLHGSGATDRNTTFTPTGSNGACLYPDLLNETSYLFRDLAYRLAEEGIGSFRYDKRTLTHGASLDPTLITIYDFVTDGVAGFQLTANHPSADPQRLYLIGHSQGSGLIPLIAEEVQAKGLISMGGNTTPIDTILARQTRDIAYQCNQDTALGNQQYDQILTAMSMVRDGSWNNSTPLLNAYEPFWKSWIDVTDSVIYNYQQADLPLLVLQGTDDFNVPPAEALPFNQLDPALTTIIEYDGLNHFFNDGDDPSTAQSVSDDIIDWIQPSTSSAGHLVGTHRIELNQYREGIEFTVPTVDELRLEIYDLNGRLVLTTAVNQRTLSVPTTHLKGMYAVRLMSKRYGIVQRILYF